MRRPTRPTLLGILLTLIVGVGLFAAAPTWAQEVDLSSFAETAGLATGASITVIIARLIRTAITLTGVVTVGFIVYGGFLWLTAGGDTERVGKAKRTLSNAVIGLVLVFASFAITSFVLNALTSATGADISGSGSSGSSTYSDSSSSSLFYLSSFNGECTESLMNVELQFVFSKAVDIDSVEDGIVIQDTTGSVVDGSFSTSGRSVFFQPAELCADYDDVYCFAPSSTYTVTLESGILESSRGSSLSCSTTYPCAFTFTTGTEVDTQAPTITMDAPEDGESVYAGSFELLQAITSDDSGVSTVDFYVIDDEEAIYTAGANFSVLGTVTGSETENPFFTDVAEEWATDGYTTNQEYDIWAKGFDCAGNSDTASRVTVVLRASSCNNGVLDTDLGETDVDCGGDSSSAFYCGACEGDACTEDSDCSSGQCVDGSCVTTPKIEAVSPGDGAVGNLVTLSGEGFGETAGTITFGGVETSAYTCDGTLSWSDDEIIVQVPEGAADGAISILTAEGEEESTDDSYGPSITDFDVNQIVRPGLCALSPDSGEIGATVDVSGTGLGSEQGTSTFYFTSVETSAYQSWSDASLEVVVPRVNAGTYRTQVFTGDYVCIDAEGSETGALCSEDADCDTEAGESCASSWCSETLAFCTDDDDCGTDEGSCESIRVGSNRVSYRVTETTSGSLPIISSVDTGWYACSDDGTRCAEDSECSSGATCDPAPNWGPSGQYITIYGSGFGSSTGSVYFDNDTRGLTALADTDFPEVCQGDFWQDSSITVKIPEEYLSEGTEFLDALTHSLVVERVSDGAQSEGFDVVVLDDSPGPAICDIDPSAGPAGTEVTVYGENLGSDGTATFYDEQNASTGLWTTTTISTVEVPGEAATGPVYVVRADSGYTSNSVTFSVGDCRVESDLCSEGESCCGDGTCSESCDLAEDVEAHYAFKISTGLTPNTPEVVVACSESGTSPSPWEGWSNPEDICVNASVEAEFNMAMEGTTINRETVVVRKCIERFTEEEELSQDAFCQFSGESCNTNLDCASLDDDACVLANEGECKQWEAVAGDVAEPDETGFSWTPDAGELEVSTLYRVTLQGEDQIMSAAGGFMESDYYWDFTTRDSEELCEVGGVNVRPSTYTATEQTSSDDPDSYVDYTAQLVAANDLCVAISCSGYALGWESDFDGARFEATELGLGICQNEVMANEETEAGSPAEITATVLDTEGDPSGSGLLTINFMDPEAADYFPDCGEACVNALPWIEFNTEMDESTLSTSTVTLYECENALCETSGLERVEFVDSISYSTATDRASLVFTELETMEADTFYRVVIDGSVSSITGVALSEAGSNYGEDENRYFEDAFSWVFQTKNDDVSCSIDSVAIAPEEATATYITERVAFEATALGAPDECSTDGQTLQASRYDWDEWTATDQLPEQLEPSSGSEEEQENIVAYMVQSGGIALTDDIPAYCTAACLNAGASVTTEQGVCGNGDIETGEECDDGGTTDGDGCSASCLNEGNVQCASACSDSGASCTSDSSCAETCESAVCSSAEDVGAVCTDDSECASGSCSSVGLCEDYDDAAASCSSDAACSGSCVGSCSISGDSCSGSDSECTYASGGTCELTGVGCCGDGALDDGEDCDDGNLESGDGCSAICLNEGSRSVGAVCGDNDLAYSSSVGGEDCDDGNTAAGDGCSRNCLLEGTSSADDVYAICGNGGSCSDDGDCDADETCSAFGQCIESGEDCDPGAFDTSGDGCSALCLWEGTETCPTSESENCCGNEDVELGEECDGEDGCSSSCLWEGASINHSTASYCGDGSLGTGEECEADSEASYSVGDYAVAQIARGAPVELNESTGYAVSEVTVTVDGDITDTVDLQLECACNTDNSCGVAGIGCGAGSCCYERPSIVEGQVSPADNIDEFEAGRSDGHCRNAAVWIDFTELMDATTFDETVDTNGNGTIDQDEFNANIYLDLVSTGDSGVDQTVIESEEQCPDGYIGTEGTVRTSAIGRFWHWMKSLVFGVFGREVTASDTFSCYVPVTYDMEEQEDGSARLYLRYTSLLEENAYYRIVVIGDDTTTDEEKDGVLSASEVTLCIGDECEDDSFTQEFAVGTDICSLDRLSVVDNGLVEYAEYESASANFFSEAEEQHEFEVTPQTYRSGIGYEEITPLEDVYDWSITWDSSITDSAEGESDLNIISKVETEDGSEDTTQIYEATGNSGREFVIATATITDDTLFVPTTESSTITGRVENTAIACANPWPSLSSETLDFPYREDSLPSNFSFYYCRDAGDADTTEDDLPALSDPIDVSYEYSTEIVQELIFEVEVEGRRDAIGVRVVPNSTYLTPAQWVVEQEFTGAFSETELNGYPAVESGNTIYVAAANITGNEIYPNIYIISYNDGASEDAEEIFAEVLSNWQFNANDDVSNVNLCQNPDDGSYVTDEDEEYISCTWDGMCYDACNGDENCDAIKEDVICDATKGRLQRDMERLLETRALIDSIDAYGDANGRCEVTTGLSCSSDDDCPGTESCQPSYPEITAGTFIPGLSTSAWGSWNAGLANALAEAVPTDPINDFYLCTDDGYDSESCWNGEEGTFQCPANSHIYGYQSVGGNTYTVYTQLETRGEYNWVADPTAELPDNAVLIAEYPYPDYAPSSATGFTPGPYFCDGTSWGDSVSCGDGTQGPSETCEIGDTTTLSCTTSSGVSGYITAACISTGADACQDFQDATEAEAAGALCVPFSCGNGVVEGTEQCDDGSLNGTYGHCSDLCTFEGSFSCGDGFLSGTEQCDCGTTSNFSTVSADDAYWATLGPDGTGTASAPWCDVSNGQYDLSANNCGFNCTLPGPSCGDGRVNGSEECDGGYEEYRGAICTDGTACETNADCSHISAFATCGTGRYAACETGSVCRDYNDAGDACVSDNQCDSGNCTAGFCTSASDAGDVCTSGTACDSGTCDDNEYELFRYRTCDGTCEWSTYDRDCVGGAQICGNGIVEGAEQCDDGNSSNNDECTNSCELNVCGDDHVYVGVEACDDGTQNGLGCDSEYGDVCNFCNATCQYQAATGGYCGDGEINGSELCDGSYATQLYYFDNGTGLRGGTCSTTEHGDQETFGSELYTCQWLGVCNGGTEHGDYCTLDYDSYVDRGVVSSGGASTDQNFCTGGECMPPVCAADCGSSCPTSYETAGLLVQSESSGSSRTGSIDLYSYLNDEGESPDNAVVYVPACTVGTQITATIDSQDVVPPDVSIVFVTDLSGSMDYDIDGNTFCNGGANAGASCTSDSQCTSGDCSKSAAPRGTRRIDYVAEATEDAIENLFNTYAGTGASMEIALVSYTGGHSGNGTALDSTFRTSSDQETLYSIVQGYASGSSPSGATPTYNGLQRGITALAARTSDVKVVILLSDGNPTLNSLYSMSGSTADECDHASFGVRNYPTTQDWAQTEGCVAEIAEDLVDGATAGVPREDIQIYTAAVTSSNTLRGYMAHISSNTCEWDQDDLDQVSDCEGNYAFAAENADEIADMYESIVDSVLGTRVTVSGTTGEVLPGSSVTLPFPEGFECQSSEQVLPLRNEFYGSGSMNFSEFTFTYCPYE